MAREDHFPSQTICFPFHLSTRKPTCSMCEAKTTSLSFSVNLDIALRGGENNTSDRTIYMMMKTFCNVLCYSDDLFSKALLQRSSETCEFLGHFCT